MNITWHGQSCFQIAIASKQNNGKVNIVIDPFDESLGLKPPSCEADIVLVSHQHSDHNNVKAMSPVRRPTVSNGVRGSPFVISSPGEYELKGIFIQGIFSFHDNSSGKERGENTIYIIEGEEMRLCHLGDLGQKELTESQLEKIGEVDILMIPIGGVYTINSAEAIKLMSQLEPRIIIPMHYQIPYSGRRPDGQYRPKLKIKLDGLDEFLKTMGIKSIEPQEKLSIKKKDISEEEAKIIVLKP